MQRQKSNFVKQAAILAIASLMVRFIGFIYRLPLTNLIGDAGNGIYGAGYNLYTFFLILSSAGLPAAISKMVSERIERNEYRNAHEVFRTALVIAIILGIISMAILGFGAQWLADLVNSPRSAAAIVALAPTVLIVSIMAVFRGYFQGMRNTLPTAISQVIEQIFNAFFSVLLAYILMKRTFDVALGAAGGTAGTGIGAFAGLICLLVIYFFMSPEVRKQAKQDVNSENFERKRDIGAELVKTALPIIIGTAIFSISNLIDLKMVNSRLIATGATQETADQLYGMLVGKYVTLSTLPVAISAAIAAASIPNIAATMAKKDKKGAGRKINSALKLAMVVSIPAAVGMWVMADPILHMLFPKYPEGASLVKLGAWSVIFLALAQVSTGMLQGIGKMKIPAIAAFVGAMVKIPINYVLIGIPSINVHGAIIGTTVCYGVAAFIDLYYLRKVMGDNLRFNVKSLFIKPFIAAGLMGVSCYITYMALYFLTSNNTFSCLATVFVGMFVYVVAMIIIKGISDEELGMFPFGGKVVKLKNKFLRS